MKESTCHEMVIHLSQRFSSMLCLFLFLQFFVISFRYDFHVDAGRMIVKARYRRRWLKKGTARYLFRREELPIFVGYGQLTSLRVIF